jgi:hypothetical protein
MEIQTLFSTTDSMRDASNSIRTANRMNCLASHVEISIGYTGSGTIYSPVLAANHGFSCREREVSKVRHSRLQIHHVQVGVISQNFVSFPRSD